MIRPIGAWPDDQLCALIGKPLPDIGKVNIKANCNADAAEIRLMNGHVVTGLHGWMKIELGPVGIDLVIRHDDPPLAIHEHGGVPAMWPVRAIDGANDVRVVLSRQGRDSLNGGAVERFLRVAPLPSPRLRQRDQVGSESSLTINPRHDLGRGRSRKLRLTTRTGRPILVSTGRRSEPAAARSVWSRGNMEPISAAGPICNKPRRPIRSSIRRGVSWRLTFGDGRRVSVS